MLSLIKKWYWSMRIDALYRGMDCDHEERRILQRRIEVTEKRISSMEDAIKKL